MATSTRPGGSTAAASAPDDAELLRRRSARYARRPAAAPEHTIDVVVFTRGRGRYAIPLTDLREIRPLRAVTAIPGASRAVPGVTCYRGQILSVHDLEAFMAAPPSGDDSPWGIIAEHADERIAILADDLTGVEAVSAEELRPLPVTLGARAAGFLGVARGDLLVLDLPALFALPAFFRAF